ncbi:MAG: hypothetical protein HC857_02350 [Synechococcales cyanobacterium RU_4_20]|nr:hypothetical protein [Synechococcales cyanobacterium RU_4_20]
MLNASSEQRPALVEDYLRDAIAHILQIDPSALAPSRSLLDSGMDSLMIMEAIHQLKQDLQLMIYPREFYERPRLDALAKYLAGEFEQSHGLAQQPMQEYSGVKPLEESLTSVNAIGPAVSRSFTVHSPLPQVPLTNSPPGRSNRQKAGPMAFILSSPRSGSTLLRVMLAGNPALFSPPELHLLPFETLGDRKRQLGVSHLGEGLQRSLMELKGLNVEASRDFIQALEDRDMPIEDVYALLQDLAGNRLLIDKSPSYASDLANLARAERCIDGAQYIHLVRHPYAVLESFCRMRMDKLVGDGQQSALDLAEKIWCASNENTQRFFESLDQSQSLAQGDLLGQQQTSSRHYLIRYEALVQHPESVLRSLCDFLEVPFDAAMLEPYQGDRMTDGFTKLVSLLG